MQSKGETQGKGEKKAGVGTKEIRKSKRKEEIQGEKNLKN